MNYQKNIPLLCLLLSFCCTCYSQESIYTIPEKSDLVFEGSSIEEALAFEAGIESTLEKQYATIVLSPELYPYVKNHHLANPKEFSRNNSMSIPCSVEYYYDRNTKKIKYKSYKWAFFNKIDDEILFDKKKLKELVLTECGELDAYIELFSKLENIVDQNHPSLDKTIKVDEIRNKKTEWKGDSINTSLSLEFQDCNDDDEMLPGWFVVRLIEYSK